MSPERTRREFLDASGTVAMASVLTGGKSFLAKSNKTIRVGFVGVGMRGSGLLDIALAMPGVDVPAICDINGDHLDKNLAVVEKARGKRPEGYGRGDEDFKRLMDRDDLDAVIISTYWQWHTPMALYAMKTGKYAGVEVPIGITPTPPLTLNRLSSSNMISFEATQGGSLPFNLTNTIWGILSLATACFAAQPARPWTSEVILVAVGSAVDRHPRGCRALPLGHEGCGRLHGLGGIAAIGIGTDSQR